MAVISEEELNNGHFSWPTKVHSLYNYISGPPKTEDEGVFRVLSSAPVLDEITDVNSLTSIKMLRVVVRCGY